MAYVWDLELQPNKKFILLAYADHANDNGESIFPSNETVAKKTGTSVRTVQRLKKELVDDGYMEEAGWHKYENNSTKLYKIPMGDNLSGVTQDAVGVTPGAERGDTGVIQTVLNHQEPSLTKDTFNPVEFWLGAFKRTSFPRNKQFMNEDGTNELELIIYNAYTRNDKDVEKFKEVVSWVKALTHKNHPSAIRAFNNAIDNWNKKKFNDSKDTPTGNGGELV